MVETKKPTKPKDAFDERKQNKGQGKTTGDL